MRYFSGLFALVCRRPLLSLVVAVALWSVWPFSSVKLQESDNIVEVKGGFKYGKTPTREMEIYPFMVQKRFLGMPGAAGVTSAVYYVTRADLEAARRRYENRGGCWPRTFSAYKRELMIVGDDAPLRRLVKREGPPPLYGEINFVRVRGSSLRLSLQGEAEDIADQIAASRTSEFFRIQDAYAERAINF